MATRTTSGSYPLVPAQSAIAAGRPARLKKPLSTSAPNRMKAIIPAVTAVSRRAVPSRGRVSPRPSPRTNRP